MSVQARELGRVRVSRRRGETYRDMLEHMLECVVRRDERLECASIRRRTQADIPATRATRFHSEQRSASTKADTTTLAALLCGPMMLVSTLNARK
jgi:hypothetical protein